ncbi:MAG TPA: alpha/beta hydrolase family protein [Candidatus Angelobacter sp.]
MHLKQHRAYKTLVFLAVLSAISCRKTEDGPVPNYPRLTPGVRMVDVTFYSVALSRDMSYRAILPASATPNQKFPVLYLLHGGGGGFRDWSNFSDVARYAEQGMILIMPEADDSYYTNSAEHPQDRYEDYIVHDLIADVEHRFPALSDRGDRAIAGLSMGGFGAVVLALKHPDLFIFSGGLSSALDVPTRPFSIKRIGQWQHYRSIFGPSGSQSRRDNDPFMLAGSADPLRIPYIFLTCGAQEGLLPVNRKFAALLQKRHFQYEFHTIPGGHDWNQWDRQLPGLIESLKQHFSTAAR